MRYHKRIRALLAIAGLVVLAASSVPAATIYQSGSNLIAFEAENADINNDFDTAGIGWLVNGVTSPPAEASGGSLVVANENNTNANDNPHNQLSYAIDFTKTGTYSVWYRVAFSSQGYEDARGDSGNNDSFYYEKDTIADATMTWQEINGIGGLSTSGWTWGTNAATLNVSSTGSQDWIVTNREDGLILDRLVLVHADHSGTVDAAFLDNLANSPVPEPSTLALATLGLLGMISFGRRRKR
jgi:hypothetical protein